MAKRTGKNAVVDFGGTIYACLTDIAVNGSAEEVTEECSTDGTGNAESFSEVAAPKWTASTTLKLDMDTSTVPAALTVGATDTLKLYLAGDESGRLEYSFTEGRVNGHGAASSIRQFGALDIQWICTGEPTIGTVT